MAALLAILKALRRAVGRDLGTLASIKVNNIFLFVALLMYGALNSGQPPKSAYPFFVLLGFLLLFPLSSDPLRRIPPARLALWPLTAGQRLGLRLASLALSPVVDRCPASAEGRAAADGARILRAGRGRAGRGGSGAACRQTRSALEPAALYPEILRTAGRTGSQKYARATHLIDPYAALLLSAGGGLYRLFGTHPDPDAFVIVGLLVALTMSTYAQSLFGLELGSGMTRYHLLPLGGWEILLAKDFAFLAVLFALLLPLDPAPGMTFGLVALALGHHSSVLLDLPQQRWRFTGGRLLPVGALQAVGGMALRFLEHQRGLAVLLAAAVAYLVSLHYYGQRWERRAAAGAAC